MKSPLSLMALVWLAFAPAAAIAEAPQNPPGQRQEEQAEEDQGPTGLLVFLDCDRRICDLDYLRREITFINYVRDRRDAQVHILVTTRFAGAGFEFNFDFIGLREFQDDDNSFTYTSSNTDTDDERRIGIAQIIRVGVLHYLVKTPLINQIEIREQVRDIPQRFLVVDPSDDPWNFWVFRFNFSGRVNGEDRRQNRSITLNFSANRTTERWKLRNNARFSYNDRLFILNDGSESKSFNRDYSLVHQTVKSLGGHWGASIKASAIHATFVNMDLATALAPGIEYNIFPYEESSRRQLTFTYEIGTGYYQYIEQTLFEETEELLVDHTFLVNFDVNQPWGEANLGIEAAQFFNDFSQWRFVIDGNLQFRIIRGLDFNVRGSWAAIRDQRYLAAQGQTDEEILLERRALDTDSRYSISFGFSYTFGSIFNNIVNPRFTGSRADFSRFHGVARGR